MHDTIFPLVFLTLCGVFFIFFGILLWIMIFKPSKGSPVDFTRDSTHGTAKSALPEYLITASLDQTGTPRILAGVSALGNTISGLQAPDANSGLQLPDEISGLQAPNENIYLHLLARSGPNEDAKNA